LSTYQPHWSFTLQVPAVKRSACQISPDDRTVDGSRKTFPVYEDKVNLNFRADAFNVLNHPVFAAPTGLATTGVDDITSGSFGQITGTSTTILPRVMQFALRLEF
jgi:hypothetical protein